MKAYSLDLRQRVVAAFEAGAPWPEIVRLFGISRATLNRYRKRLRDAGSLAPGRSPGRPRGIAPPDEPLLEARLRDAPDAGLADHCRWWRDERGEAVSVAALRRAVRRLGWTRKKTPRRQTPLDVEVEVGQCFWMVGPSSQPPTSSTGWSRAASGRPSPGMAWRSIASSWISPATRT